METVILSARPQNFLTIWVMLAVGLAVYFVGAQVVKKVSAGQNG